jgi:hypothetical protein
MLHKVLAAFDGENHTRVAELTAAISGGSFVTAHWFVVADTLAHFAASVVSVITGVAAIAYYVRGFIRRHWGV